MHSCINNSENDVSHLEQVTNEFFPYSRKQLGFDKPVTIIFQSDAENSSKMLGKTAFYNPQTFEVVLYTDNRHPKDILRSLSHELVHHAQNCRGDFTGDFQTVDGYAQSDPHLRSMEREAYTKGNLIFRDFEDLIKTGKINIEIDFSDSGEPKMSLKEWKNNEINTKLMKKWGFLKESKNEPADVKHGDDVLAGEEAGEEAAEELGEGCSDVSDLDEDDLEEGFFGGDAIARAKLADAPPDKMDPPASRVLDRRSMAQANKGAKVSGKKLGDLGAAGGRRNPRTGPKPIVQEKISVREAKEITRRIIERVRKEGN